MSNPTDVVSDARGNPLAAKTDPTTKINTLKVIATPDGGGSGATDATTTAVTITTASTVVLAASPTRRGGSFKNTHATATIYLTFGSTTPTTALYTIDVLAGEYYEIPSMYWGLACNGIVASGTAVLNKTDAT